MKSKKILLVSHIYFTKAGAVYGPVDVLKAHLDEKKSDYLLIKYPLISWIPLPIKSFLEILNTLFRGFLYKPDVFIGIDPLNALAGVVLRKLRLATKTIFYCVDYTPARFENKLINSVYLGIDKYCALNSDQVWNVSTRILEIRRKQDIPEGNIKFIPNSPSFSDCPRQPLRKIDRSKIVMVTGLTHSPVFDLVLSSFKKTIKKFPRLYISIIGTGEYQEKLIAKVGAMGLTKSVKFLGQLSNKSLLDEVSKSGLALAIYTFSEDYSWVYYGDSKKAREYLACGVPVIITDVVGTADDIKKYKAGIVINPSVKNLSSAIERFLVDKSFWLKCRGNAVKLAKKYDMNRLLDENFATLEFAER